MQNLRDFWALVVSVWKDGVLGIDVGNIITALGIFLGFLIIRRIFSWLVIRQIRHWTRKSRNKIDDHIIDVLEHPIRFIPVVMGLFFATEYLDLEGLAATIAENINRSLIAFVIFWGFFNIVRPVGDLLEVGGQFVTEAMAQWIRKAANIGIILIGAATILEIWGIQVGPIIAGLGLFGVAVALGAQDLFKNLIAGIFIISERRFHPGDWIFADGVVEGTVEQIGFRTTRVRRFDKAPVYVPNSKLSDNAVTNFSEMTHRRIKWIIGVEYRTSLEQLRQVRQEIEDYVLNSDAFARPEEVSTFVRIDSFNDSSIDILLYCFTRTTVWGEWLEIKEQLAMKIKDIVEGAGTGFAFPSRSLYLETLPDAPEIFPLQAPAQKDDI